MSQWINVSGICCYAVIASKTKKVKFPRHPRVSGSVLYRNPLISNLICMGNCVRNTWNWTANVLKVQLINQKVLRKLTNKKYRKYYQRTIPKWSQTNKNRVLANLLSILLLQWCCRVIPKMLPKGVKTEIPSFPNGKRQKQKGSAAEGVALKIYWKI